MHGTEVHAHDFLAFKIQRLVLAGLSAYEPAPLKVQVATVR